MGFHSTGHRSGWGRRIGRLDSCGQGWQVTAGRGAQERLSVTRADMKSGGERDPATGCWIDPESIGGTLDFTGAVITLKRVYPSVVNLDAILGWSGRG